MLLVLKNKLNEQAENWQPSASLANLKARAVILKKIRDFFAARAILEVETPLLCHTSVTDPFIESFSVKTASKHYLQTSPEYAMKRLLAAGSGSIYQLAKAFRQDETGRYHNPEFTLLEWYQVGFNHHDLMDTMDDFLQQVIQAKKAYRLTYADLFQQSLNINPHTATLETLAHLAKKLNLEVTAQITDKDTWLNLFMTHRIEGELGHDCPCFIYDFPPTQAALARIQPTEPPVASRFEVYFKGTELANGFHELQNAHEQRLRFEHNLEIRRKTDLPILPIDENFLSALHHGLPNCAGVALGVDRLMMIALSATHIAEVLSFDFTRA